jgi:hypothetical protein
MVGVRVPSVDWTCIQYEGLATGFKARRAQFDARSVQTVEWLAGTPTLCYNFSNMADDTDV